MEVKVKAKRWIISLIGHTFINCGQSLATFITVCILIFTKRNDMPDLNFFAMIYLFGIFSSSITSSIPRVLLLFNDVRGALHRIEIFLKTTEYSQEESVESVEYVQNGNKQNITLSRKLDDLARDLKLETKTTSSSDRRQLPFLNIHDVTCQLPSKMWRSSQSAQPCNEGSPLLKNINLEVTNPELVLICGAVGSGKSSLLKIVIGGELLVTNGSVSYFGKLAVVSDSPWVFPGTIRENILFGLSYNESRYNKIIKACQLEKDFDSFPDQDLARIGEHGVTVSGGQRTRIALARAVYSDADIYLLDDPLSSLDINVAENVFRY